MKKIAGIFLTLILCFCLIGCGDKVENTDKDNKNNDTNINDNSNQSDQKTNSNTFTISEFITKVQDIATDMEKTEMMASFIGANEGYKLSNDNTKLEIYSFDKSSEAYKQAEESQKISMEGFGEFNAIVKNGYALVIDENFPEYSRTLELFEKLK